MKRLIPIVLCLLVIGILALPTMAEGTTQFTITPSKAQVTQGEEITFTITVSGTNEYTSVGLRLVYESAVYEYVQGSATCSHDIANVAVDEGNGVFSISGDLNKPTFVPNGKMATFKLKVKSNADLTKDATVSAQISKANTNTGTAGDANVNSANVNVSCNHVYDNNCDTTCNSCNAERVAPHTPDAGTVTDEPDCATGKAGTKTYKCTVCQETVKTEPVPAEHKFSENWQNDGTNHWHKCEKCGAKGGETGHTAGEWFSDGTNHWHVCTACQALMDKAAHTPGAAATEYAGQKCTACQKELKPPLGHTCNFSDKWKTDDKGHWHECSGCEDIDSYGAHVFDNACDTDCNTCGYTRNPEHIYAERWSQDANGHWHECELCGEGLELEPHQPGPEATLASPQICVVCGYEIAPSLGHTHKYEGQWQKDAEGHWKICSCGMESDKTAHNWDQGVVTRKPTETVVGRRTYTCTDCGEQKSESIDTVPGTDLPGQNSQVEKPGFPWWIIIVIVAIPVVAVCVYIVVGVAKGKKQTGKYSQQPNQEPDEALDTE